METATVEKLKLAVRLSQVWLLPVIAPIVSSWCTIQAGGYYKKRRYSNRG